MKVLESFSYRVAILRNSFILPNNLLDHRIIDHRPSTIVYDYELRITNYELRITNHENRPSMSLRDKEFFAEIMGFPPRGIFYHIVMNSSTQPRCNKFKPPLVVVVNFKSTATMAAGVKRSLQSPQAILVTIFCNCW